MKTFETGVEHAAMCDGDPVITVSRGGEWSAHCHHVADAVECYWEVTGCGSRAEAGAAFFGCDLHAHDGDHYHFDEEI